MDKDRIKGVAHEVSWQHATHHTYGQQRTPEIICFQRRLSSVRTSLIKKWLVQRQHKGIVWNHGLAYITMHSSCSHWH